MTPDQSARARQLWERGARAHAAGELATAEQCYRGALEQDRSLLPAWANLIALAQAEHGKAVVAGAQARSVQLGQELARLLNNQGTAVQGLGGMQEAIASYRNAVAVAPDFAAAWSNLGNILRDVGQAGEAEAACRRAIALDATLAAAWNNLGNALADQARFDEVGSCYARALELRPGFPPALQNAGSGALFNLLYVPEISNAEISARHRTWGAAYPAPRDRPWQRSRDPDRVLRVGYLSADFRQHAMRHFLEPLLAQHRRSDVEVVCYAQGPQADADTQRLMAYGHAWCWVHGMTDAELAARIEHDAIDILVDCMGHTQDTRITALAGKPAPLMMSWVAYACTTGLPAMDYRLTDEWVDPPDSEQPLDTDALLRIPGGMMAYRPHSDAPEPGVPPCTARPYITFGSLNNILKLNRVVVALWAQVLHAVPNARLLLQSKLLVDVGTVGRIRGMFEAFGIPPGRLDLRPASTQYPHAYPDIDIAMDTLPFGGGVTTCDALWMGVPVLTLAQPRPIGRLSISILNQSGHPGWVADTPEDFVAKASTLAASPESLARIRRGLRDQMRTSALCDEAGFAVRMEAVYRAAWRRWIRAG